MQATLVLSGNVQYMGFRRELEELLTSHNFSGFVYNDRRDWTVKIVCEGDEAEIKRLGEKISSEYPEVSISLEEKVILPKPAGRVVVGMEQEIFERLDLGVSRLGSIDERLGSVDTKLDKLSSVDGKLDGISGKLNKLDSMDEKLGKLDSMDGKLDSMNGKLDTLKDIKKVLEKIAEK